MKLKVFIIDDIQSMRMLVAQFLKRHKEVEVVGMAEGCTEALQKIKQLHPDVVLTDLSLSDGSGIDVVRQVKEILPKTSVYLFSAYEVDEIRDLRTLRSSSDGFIQKSNLKLELNVMILKELERQKKSQT
ncbi:MAG: response regulator transcription factor [Bacteroidota bacterium]